MYRKKGVIRGEYLQEAEHLRDNDAGDDQEVADDDGGARPAEEVAQEEGQDHLGVSPQQEHHHDDQWVGLGRRHTNSGGGHHIHPQCHWAIHVYRHVWIFTTKNLITSFLNVTMKFKFTDRTGDKNQRWSIDHYYKQVLLIYFIAQL